MFKFITTLFTKCGRLKNILKYIYLALITAKAGLAALKGTFSETNKKYKTLETIIQYLTVGVTCVETAMDWLGVTVEQNESADITELEAAMYAAINDKPEIQISKSKKRKNKSSTKRKRVKQHVRK